MDVVNGGSFRIATVERMIIWIRYLLVPFGIIHIATFVDIELSSSKTLLAYSVVGIMLIGNLLLHLMLEKEKYKVVGIGSLILDSCVVAAMLMAFIELPQAAVFILIYFIPLEAAALFGMRAAVQAMLVWTPLYIAFQVYGAHSHGYEHIITNVTFHMGMGVVFTGIVGGMITGWSKDRDKIDELYKQAKNNIQLLEEVDLLKNNFLGAIAHELRTPLVTIMGFANQLHKRGSQVGVNSSDVIMITYIKNESERLNRILSDLLDVNKLKHGQIPVKPSIVDIREMIKGSVESVKITSGREILIEGDDMIAVIDKTHGERIVENLLLNATKYTPEGADIVIRADRNQASNGVVFSVIDQGPGVSDKYKAEIFKAFHRGEGIEQVPSGAGVGLALVSQLAELHGGRAWVEDGEDGQGSVFRAELLDQGLAEVGLEKNALNLIR